MVRSTRQIMIVLALVMVDASLGQDVPKHVTAGGRFFRKFFHHRKPRPPPYQPRSSTATIEVDCPHQDYVTIMNNIHQVQNVVLTLFNSLDEIKQVNVDVAALGDVITQKEDHLIEWIQNLAETVRTTVSNSMRDVKVAVKSVERKVINSDDGSCSKAEVGDITRVESAIDTLEDIVRKSTVVQENRENKTEKIVKSILEKVTQISSSGLGSSASQSCSDSPGIISAVITSQQVAKEIKKLIQTITRSFMEVKTAVQSVSIGPGGYDSKSFSKELKEIKVQISTLKQEISNLDISVSANLDGVTGQFSEHSEIIDSLNQIIKKTTKETSSRAASAAAATAVKKLSGVRNLCPNV